MALRHHATAVCDYPSRAQSPVDRRWAVPVAVSDFCVREGLSEELALAARLIQQHFGRLPRCVELVEDPDSGETWVSVHVALDGAPEQCRDRYRRYTANWVRAVAPERRFRIRLACSLE